jgi:uridine phosphorylase
MSISQTDLMLNSDGSIYHLSLLPKQVSDTIITVGDPSRVYRVSEHFDKLDFEMNKREFITHIGRYNGKRVTVMSTGIGTDNIELFMTELDALVNIDLTTRELKSRKKKLKIGINAVRRNWTPVFARCLWAGSAPAGWARSLKL